MLDPSQKGCCKDIPAGYLGGGVIMDAGNLFLHTHLTQKLLQGLSLCCDYKPEMTVYGTDYTARAAGECRTHSKEPLTELKGGSVAGPTALWEEGRMSQKSNL